VVAAKVLKPTVSLTISLFSAEANVLDAKLDSDLPSIKPDVWITPRKEEPSTVISTSRNKPTKANLLAKTVTMELPLLPTHTP